MTMHRDFDELSNAWLDLMPDEAPARLVDNIRLAVDATPQARAWRPSALLRPFQSNRFSLVALVAALAVAIIGGAVLVISGLPPTPKPAPSASIAPTESPSATGSPSLPAATFAPEGLRGTWVALAGPGSSGTAAPPLIRLVIAANGAQVTASGTGVYTTVAHPVQGALDELTLVQGDDRGPCRPDDLGRYRYAFGSDGPQADTTGYLLGLTVVSDTCAARQSILDRSWVHTVDDAGNGGPGLLSSLGRWIAVTLPPGRYGGEHAADRVDVETPTRQFVGVRNPAGFSDPCASSSSSKLAIAPSIAAFESYLEGLPGFGTASKTPITIDGHPATRLTIPSTPTPECAVDASSQARVAEFATSDPLDTVYWFLTLGDTDVMYLVELDGDLFLFQWLGDGVTGAEEAQVVASIQFLEAFP